MEPTTIQKHLGDNATIVLPNGIDFPSTQVYVKRISNALILIPADNPWQLLFDSLELFSDDCFANFETERNNFVADQREELFP